MPKKDTGTPLLSAEWVNEAMDEVYDRAMEIYEAIFRDLFWSGYLPMERPASDDFMKRLTPEQRAAFGLEEPAPEGESALALQ